MNETFRPTSIKPFEDMKIILLWTSFFHWKDFNFGLGQEPFLKAGCRFTNCMTTNDRSLINQSKALIFHPTNFKIKDLPSYRTPDQRYIYSFFESSTKERSLPIFHKTPKGYFNWTMTHRRDSDIYSSQFYGSLRRRATSKVVNTLPVLLSPGTLPSDPAVVLKGRQNQKNKTKLVAWFNSHCPTKSRREVFFRKMGQFIPIDIYGRCGTFVCLPWNSLKCDKIIVDYKFYISAENSFCADYVTEKFYRALEAGVIPIVYGGADYSAYAPPHSFINAADFDSPKALADYLKLLDGNHRLYSKYLEWRNDWEVIRNPMDGWCDLCEKLNAPIKESKSYDNITKWWFDDVPCLPEKSVNKIFNLSSIKTD